MADERTPTIHERWALLRFSVVGRLLASPPPRGELRAELERLAASAWRHPVTARPTRFGVSTIEPWYYQAKHAGTDPVGVLRKRVRRDSGRQPSVGERLRPAIHAQYAAHKSWSVQLHYDNLRVLVERDPALGTLPSYATVRRYMKAVGLVKRRRLSSKETAPCGRRSGGSRSARCGATRLRTSTASGTSTSIRARRRCSPPRASG